MNNESRIILTLSRKQGCWVVCSLFQNTDLYLKDKQGNKQAFILLKTIQNITRERLFWTHNSEFTSLELVGNNGSFLEMSALLNTLLLDFCITHSLRIWNYGKRFYFKGIHYQHNFVGMSLLVLREWWSWFKIWAHSLLTQEGECCKSTSLKIYALVNALINHSLLFFINLMYFSTNTIIWYLVWISICLF